MAVECTFIVLCRQLYEDSEHDEVGKCTVVCATECYVSKQFKSAVCTVCVQPIDYCAQQCVLLPAAHLLYPNSEPEPFPTDFDGQLCLSHW